jgi:phosphomannomutase
VVEHKADFGVAFDGDGDRLAMADRDGTLFDGDQLLYAMVKHRHGEGRLRGGVVGTLMTNFALERRLAEMGIPFTRAKVGDRYVLESLRERGWELGGENSGHLLCLDCHSTGDAMISALQVLAAVVATGQTIGTFTSELKLLPQVLVNVKHGGNLDLQAAPLREAVAKAEADLAGRGRVLLRPSGTEAGGARHGRGRRPRAREEPRRRHRGHRPHLDPARRRLKRARRLLPGTPSVLKSRGFEGRGCGRNSSSATGSSMAALPATKRC